MLWPREDTTLPAAWTGWEEEPELGAGQSGTTHQQRRVVAAPDGLVKSCHSLPRPEIQVRSPIAQCLDHLGAELQLSGCCQGTLCRAPGERQVRTTGAFTPSTGTMAPLAARLATSPARAPAMRDTPCSPRGSCTKPHIRSQPRSDTGGLPKHRACTV